MLLLGGMVLLFSFMDADGGLQQPAARMPNERRFFGTCAPR